jgi:hypothetical protein
VRALFDYIIAVPFALLPRRRWNHWDLPIENVNFASALLTCLGGAALGITGFFSYMAYVLAQREWTAPPMMIYVYLSYILATPRGLFSLYLAITGFVRIAAWHVNEPSGDPLLTVADELLTRWKASQRQRSERAAREQLEGADEPDRRYDAAWAGLSGVDFVIVAARRKPEWTRGTWVVTDEGWFVLGEPFDRPTPNGIRTVYPLTLRHTLEAVRRSVPYRLPPLRETAAVTRASKQQ